MSTTRSIVVIGSSNTDMVIKTKRFPQPGETVLGGEFFLFQGGKGANQAVSASRLGGNVSFISKLGSDIFGDVALKEYQKEKINTQHIIRDASHPTGVALITVDDKGENTIVVAPGANGELSSSDLQPLRSVISSADVILMQLEIPLSTVSWVFNEASRVGKKIILNPAPATKLAGNLLMDLFLLTPNEHELEILAGEKVFDLKSVERASKKLIVQGVQNVITTLGKAGAYLYNVDGGINVPAPLVHAVDTTAAGDVFNGALAVAIVEGKSLEASIHFANQCAAISVTRMGAQNSCPFRNEITESVLS
jgi:ribokinase